MKLGDANVLAIVRVSSASLELVTELSFILSVVTEAFDKSADLINGTKVPNFASSSNVGIFNFFWFG